MESMAQILENMKYSFMAFGIEDNVQNRLKHLMDLREEIAIQRYESGETEAKIHDDLLLIELSTEILRLHLQEVQK